MAKRGRRTKYTPEVVTALTQAVALGATLELACHFAGIGVSTFYEYQAQYPEFIEAIKKAEGRAAVGWLAKIEKAANDGNWQAAAWKLERRYPHFYGKQIVQMDDWRSEAVEGLRKGEITPERAINVFGDELARELFSLAGVAQPKAGSHD